MLVVDEKEGQLRLGKSGFENKERCTNLEISRDFTCRKIDAFLKRRYPLLKEFQDLFAQYEIR